MSDERDNLRQDQPAGASDGASSKERREAIIKLGKYAAYATPIVVASMSSALGGPAPISAVAPPPPP